VLTGFVARVDGFAIDHYDACVPDMMTLGKVITSGHAPLERWREQRVAHHFDTNTLMTGLTHTAHPISLAAALGNLEALLEEGLVERSENSARG